MGLQHTNLIKRTALFLEEILLRSDHAAVQAKVVGFLGDGNVKSHVLYKNSSLYFIHQAHLLDDMSVRCDFRDRDYVRFDGQRITRIDPDYYLGAAGATTASGASFSFSLSFGESSTNNNNNNNNNNNGNNNG
ncbi:hypothetical protein SAMN05660964_00518 [Thiothrix caldifontis]|uniref:Uncharacterized protein n=1 Tax=Thiothrix caldifontis TaxID=525918 RepID=A0A1H3WN71_9GAMM|nr:hypothetical protein [Thiothrix caldifontis]SDZ88573.1 hypothetical protein SAMN05660964_00518 [Thiothrix caldifontis]